MVIVPATLTIIFLAVSLLIGLLLLVASMRRGKAESDVPDDVPVDPSRYGPGQTNRWLRLMRLCFALICIVALGFHAFWIFGAPGDDEFDRFAMRDQRNRRLAEAGLRGWVFDRTGKPERALAKYRLDGTRIVRDYPLRDAATNLSGYSDFVYGSAGFERAFSEQLTKPISARNTLSSPAPVGTDVTTTIDADLQKEAYRLLKGKRGAAVVIAVPSGEVLAMASCPSFDPAIVTDDSAWKRLNEDAVKAPELSPMTDRALKTYYLPGSTFKVVVALAAIEAGLADRKFTCTHDGFVAPKSRRPITDDSDGVHGTIDLPTAVRVSCNQYFAQMGLALGPARLGEVARRFGIKTGAPGALRDPDLWRFKTADPTDFVAAFGPPPARLALPSDFNDEFSPYDLAIESFGQGPNQMTIFELALIAAGLASPNAQLNKPSLEAGVDPVFMGQVGAPEATARVRQMMRDVVEHGTAAGAFAALRGRGITAGGKTGTAQRDVVEYDPRTLEPLTYKDREGKEHVRFRQSIDALFLGFAPFDNPQIAFAMIVEDGGHGGTAAAPIAVGLIEKARELRLVR